MAASGVFLLDSESQLQEAINKLLRSRLVGAAPEEDAEAGAVDASRWTCPMHPEIQTDAGGSCPICGMDLVPMPAASEPASGDHAGHAR